MWLFVKVKDDAYFNELERLVVTKTRAQINEHEEWYKNYMNLKELKRVAIKKWRENKNVIIDTQIEKILKRKIILIKSNFFSTYFN